MRALSLRTAILFTVLLASAVSAAERDAAGPSAADGLAQGFARPPETTKPWCYWYWISDNISREGITRDLEAMARFGIGEALIGNIFLDDVPAGRIKVLSDEWWGLIEHAIREGGRVGVNIGMFNCPGWSQSGGPWIKPSQSMRYLVSSETRVTGPSQLSAKLPVPAEEFQDLAVLAMPAPEEDADSLTLHEPKLTCTPPVSDAARMVDGRLETVTALPSGAMQGDKALAIDIELPKSIAVRSLSVTPADSAWAADCELQVGDGAGNFRPVRSFHFDRSNMARHVGPMPQGPVTIALEAVRARQFRLIIRRASGKPSIAEIALSAAARLESYVEKQLGKMHPTPLPMWDAYLWPAQAEPESPRLTVPSDQVHDLTAKMDAEGHLTWDVPAGDWIILRTGMAPTGTRNSPASPEGQGLEVDKMNRAAAQAHFEAFIGEVLRRIPAAERTAFKHVVADSYEMGSQNWTDGFGATFRSRYGYDPLPWLPVLTGRIVGSADQSNRFLWDLRRLVADHIAVDYVGGLRDLCRPHGLQLWLENYGHWGFPAEFLQYGGQSDRVGGEFWVTGDLGSIECRAASSAANTYGFPFVSAEAFTGGPPFQTAPWGTKARGDWAFCEGINHFVLHVYIHQPWEDRKPGVNAWFGTEFNRHNTWFAAAGAWTDYLRRCSFMLQQGTRAADIAYFIGEDTPKMTGIRRPELPPGYDFDYINAEVILTRLEARDGVLVLPHGARYHVLVLPEQSTMRPELLRKIRELVRSGATVLGPPPQRSPSMENYPQCDVEVQRLSAEIWGQGEGGSRRFGRGAVVWGQRLDEVLESMDVGPDFVSETPLRYTHRRAGATDIYFVANPRPEEVSTTAAFRVGRRLPELWWPETGRTERPAVYRFTEAGVQMPLVLAPHESVFVVFRHSAEDADPVISVTRDGEPILDTELQLDNVQRRDGTESPGSDFSFAVWVKPAADTTLLAEANTGVHGMAEPRNDAIFPPHGQAFGGGGHAGSGLAVGRNGVCIFEHGSNYFAPVLVHPAKIDDWTHVAVVYRENQPHLYLDGRLTRRGLKSRFTVHSGVGAAGGGGSPFRGEIGSFESFPRALAEDEITALVESMPRPGTRLAARAIQLVRDEDGGLIGRAWQTGTYTLRTAAGNTRSLAVAAAPQPLAITGPWEVKFTFGWGAPEQVRFERLVDWAEYPDQGVRHYSGTAVYATTFDLPRTMDDKTLCLRLGTVRDLAHVRLNGNDIGTLWLAPWSIDVTEAVKPGSNVLEVEVVNSWNNRLVGDYRLSPEQRRTFLAVDTLSRNAPLLPAGLLGPVMLEAAETVRLRETASDRHVD